MSLIQIPSLVESNISEYLAESENITYPVYKAFSVNDFSLPCVLVKSGKYQEMEVKTGVFTGTFIISIISQIDEVQNVLQTHDDITGYVYDALLESSLADSFNENGKLWFISLESIDQDKQDRSLITLLEYSITCQNLTLV
jgi:hypothetical protein